MTCQPDRKAEQNRSKQEKKEQMKKGTEQNLNGMAAEDKCGSKVKWRSFSFLFIS
jgi:hypothetical protein